MNAPKYPQENRSPIVIVPARNPGEFGIELSPWDIKEIINNDPLTRFQIWQVLAEKHSLKGKFALVYSTLSIILVELRKSGWINVQANSRGQATYTRATDLGLTCNYPFSKQFCDRLAARYATHA